MNRFKGPPKIDVMCFERSISFQSNRGTIEKMAIVNNVRGEIAFERRNRERWLIENDRAEAKTMTDFRRSFTCRARRC